MVLFCHQVSKIIDLAIKYIETRLFKQNASYQYQINRFIRDIYRLATMIPPSEGNGWLATGGISRVLYGCECTRSSLRSSFSILVTVHVALRATVSTTVLVERSTIFRLVCPAILVSLVSSIEAEGSFFGGELVIFKQLLRCLFRLLPWIIFLRRIITALILVLLLRWWWIVLVFIILSSAIIIATSCIAIGSILLLVWVWILLMIRSSTSSVLAWLRCLSLLCQVPVTHA